MLNIFWHAFLMLTESKVRPASGIRHTEMKSEMVGKFHFCIQIFPSKKWQLLRQTPKLEYLEYQLNRPSQIISIATALTGPHSVPGTAVGIQPLSPTNLGGWMKGATVTNYEHRPIFKSTWNCARAWGVRPHSSRFLLEKIKKSWPRGLLNFKSNCWVLSHSQNLWTYPSYKLIWNAYQHHKW